MGLNQIKVKLVNHSGSDESIAQAAWQSSNTYEIELRKQSHNDVERLIRETLVPEGHMVPVEHVHVSFWLRLPVFIDRQLMTHRIGSQSGMSARYRVLGDEFYISEMDESIPDDCGLLDGINKACADSVREYKKATAELKLFKASGRINNTQYKRLRETLRNALPQSHMVERYSTFNLSSFANIQAKRNTDEAQLEIRHMAQLMLAAVKEAEVAPIAVSALEAQDWVTCARALKVIKKLKARLNAYQSAA